MKTGGDVRNMHTCSSLFSGVVLLSASYHYTQFLTLMSIITRVSHLFPASSSVHNLNLCNVVI